VSISDSMDTRDAGRKGGLKKWAKVKGKRARSEIMKRVRRGKKTSPNRGRKLPGSSNDTAEEKKGSPT
jgi:hypothetical protein